MTYPIKSELARAHKLICQAGFHIVMQIVLKRYKPAETKMAHAKVTKALGALQNLIDGTGHLV